MGVVSTANGRTIRLMPHFNFNPKLWESVVAAASPNYKIKGFIMVGTDYSKAVLPGTTVIRAGVDDNCMIYSGLLWEDSIENNKRIEKL